MARNPARTTCRRAAHGDGDAQIWECSRIAAHAVDSPSRVRLGSPVAWLWRDARRWFAAVYIAIPAACALDAGLSLSERQQWLLAAVAWLIVAGGLVQLSPRRRLALVCFLPLITLTELLLTHVLDWYAYRLDNIPPWIPPAHGIVFLTALRAIDTQAISRARWPGAPRSLRPRTAR